MHQELSLVSIPAAKVIQIIDQMAFLHYMGEFVMWVSSIRFANNYFKIL